MCVCVRDKGGWQIAGLFKCHAKFICCSCIQTNTVRKWREGERETDREKKRTTSRKSSEQDGEKEAWFSTPHFPAHLVGQWATVTPFTLIF